MMRRSIVITLLLLALIPSMNLKAKELILEPEKVTTIVSPSDSRDSRILVYFELPKELYGPMIEIDNAALVFKAEVKSADFGMLHVFPVVKDWKAATEVSWGAPWDSLGGDFSTNIAGRSLTMKRAQGQKEISSNVLFLVKDWLDGSIANNGIIIVPSAADLAESAVEFGIEKTSMRLIIFYRD